MKSQPIWCGSLDEKHRQLIIDKIEPLVRGRILATIAERASVMGAIASTVEGIANGTRCPECGASWNVLACGSCDGLGCKHCDDMGEFGDCEECGNIE